MTGDGAGNGLHENSNIDNIFSLCALGYLESWNDVYLYDIYNIMPYLYYSDAYYVIIITTFDGEKPI